MRGQQDHAFAGEVAQRDQLLARQAVAGRHHSHRQHRIERFDLDRRPRQRQLDHARHRTAVSTPSRRSAATAGSARTPSRSAGHRGIARWPAARASARAPAAWPPEARRALEADVLRHLGDALDVAVDLIDFAAERPASGVGTGRRPRRSNSAQPRRSSSRPIVRLTQDRVPRRVGLPQRPDLRRQPA